MGATYIPAIDESTSFSKEHHHPSAQKTVAKPVYNDDALKKQVNAFLEPIVLEFQEQQPFNELLKGQEKDMIQQIYRLTKLSDFPNRESVMFHLKSLVDTIHERDQKLQAEKKRNSQSLNLSIIGLILTIILSSISICIGLFGWSL